MLKTILIKLEKGISIGRVGRVINALKKDGLDRDQVSELVLEALDDGEQRELLLSQFAQLPEPDKSQQEAEVLMSDDADEQNSDDKKKSSASKDKTNKSMLKKKRKRKKKKKKKKKKKEKKKMTRFHRRY
jgi:prophage tail gpP-like protein